MIKEQEDRVRYLMATPVTEEIIEEMAKIMDPVVLEHADHLLPTDAITGLYYPLAPLWELRDGILHHDW